MSKFQSISNQHWLQRKMKALPLGIRWCLLRASYLSRPSSWHSPGDPMLQGNSCIPTPAQITSSYMTLHLLCAPDFACWATSWISSLGDPPASMLTSSLIPFWSIYFLPCFMLRRHLSFGLPCHPLHGSTVSHFFLLICPDIYWGSPLK